MEIIQRLIAKSKRKLLNLKSHFGLLSWKDIERFDTNWNGRVELMSSHIPSDCESILDLGCGIMYLKELIPHNCKYFPVDYTNRGPETILCDFNKGQYPGFSVRVAFLSGILEYVFDYEWFIAECVRSSSIVIVSYCTLENFPNIRERKNNSWKNHLRESDLIALFSRHGASKLEQNIYNKNTILVFEKMAS